MSGDCCIRAETYHTIYHTTTTTTTTTTIKAATTLIEVMYIFTYLYGYNIQFVKIRKKRTKTVVVKAFVTHEVSWS